MPPTLTAIIGKRVKLLRRRSGRTQDDVATAARDCGLPWGRSTVAELEAGSKRLGAEELLLLPVVLLRAFDLDPAFAEVVGPEADLGEKWIELTPDARITYTALADLLSGTLVTTSQDDLDVPYAREQDRAYAEDLDRLKTYRPLWPRTSLLRLALAEQSAAGEAEQKAARKLGVPAAHVAVVAHRLWGRGLTAERDQLVAERGVGGHGRSIQAARGHVTRTLVAEIERTLKKD